jgi:hypothetical protein
MRDFIRENRIYDIRNPRTYDKKGVIKIVSFEENDDETYNLVIEDMKAHEILEVDGLYHNGYFHIFTPNHYILSNFNQSIKKPRSRSKSRYTKTRHGGNPNKNRKSKKRSMHVR